MTDYMCHFLSHLNYQNQILIRFINQAQVQPLGLIFTTLS